MTGTDRFSLFDVANVVIRHWKIVVVFPIVVGVALTTVVLLLPRRFESRASFVPQAREGGLSQIAGLAAQLGIGMPAEAAGESVDFYATLLKSQRVLRQVVEAEFRLPRASRDSTGSLVDVFRSKGATSETRVDAAMKQLDDAITVRVRREAGLVDYAVVTKWPEISEAIAEQLLDLVSAFDVGTRQTRAAAERRFVEARLAEARDSLRTAEGRLTAFLQANRQYLDSPLLVSQYEQIQRQVSLYQQLFVSLAQAHEQARIAEVRDTPVITVLDPPSQPIRPRSRGLIVKVVFGVLAAALVGMGFALATELVRKGREEDPEGYERLAVEASQMVQGLRWKR